MNDFSKYYTPVETENPYLGLSISRLVEIWFYVTDDVATAVQKWEQMGFIRIESTDGSVNEGRQDQVTFCNHAAAIGASLVVYRGWPSPPDTVYLAPKSATARQQAEFSSRYGSAAIVMHSTPPTASTHIGPKVYNAAHVSLVHTADLSGMVNTWEKRGFVTLGTADAAGKNNAMGFSDRLCSAAISVGASLVIVQITPSKARAIQRNVNGRIDMEAVRADPPTKMYNGGSCVVQVVFLAPTSTQARELAESELGSRNVPLELEA